MLYASGKVPAVVGDATEAVTPVFIVLAFLAVVLGGAYLAVLRRGAPVSGYATAAAVSMELEGRSVTRGVVGTTAARVVALAALAVIFSSTAQSTTESSMTEVVRVQTLTSKPCWSSVCRRPTGDLCSCKCAELNAYVANVARTKDPLAKEADIPKLCDPTCALPTDDTKRVYADFDQSSCAEIQHGYEPPVKTCGGSVVAPFVHEQKQMSDASTLICVTKATANVFSTIEAFGISLGWAEVIYMVMLFLFKATSTRIMNPYERKFATQVFEELNSDAAPKSPNKKKAGAAYTRPTATGSQQKGSAYAEAEAQAHTAQTALYNEASASLSDGPTHSMAAQTDSAPISVSRPAKKTHMYINNTRGVAFDAFTGDDLPGHVSKGSVISQIENTRL